MASHEQTRQAAIHLDEALRGRPDFHSVGISGAEDAPLLIVYLRRANRKKDAALPSEWEGIPVSTRIIGRIMHANHNRGFSFPTH